MKQLKSIALIVLIAIGWIISADAQDDQKTPKLSDEQKRFDHNGDGQLSEEEEAVMLRVTNVEAFTGDKLSREEIERIRASIAPDRAGADFGRMPPGFGGMRGGFGGGRRGPGPAEKL